MNIHQALEVFDCLDPEFKGRVLVDHKDGAWVLLESRDGPHVTDALLYGLVESIRLVSSGDDDHYLQEKKRSRIQFQKYMFEINWVCCNSSSNGGDGGSSNRSSS